MLKGISVLILLLLPTGIALSLYLPKHQTSIPSLALYAINNDSLKEPIEESTLLTSRLISADSGDKIQYALQLGMFGTLEVATNYADKQAQLLAHKKIELPLLPTIIKLRDSRRSWLILSLGPFDKQHELERYQTLLLNQGVNSQVILWPDAAMPKKKSQ